MGGIEAVTEPDDPAPAGAVRAAPDHVAPAAPDHTARAAPDDPARAGDVAGYAPLARRPVTDMITDLIMSRIRSGALKPGDKLPAEPELARQLQVGRGSLREAIRTLHTLGVLQVVRGRGTFIAEPMSQAHSPQFLGLSSASGPELAQILELRIGLETAAISLACIRATPDDVQAMRDRAAEHEQAVDSGDHAEQRRTDEAFHEAVVLAAHNPHLLGMYRMIVPRIAEFRQETLKLERSSERFVPGHRDIVDGIAGKNPRAGRNAVIRHIAGLYQELRSAMRSAGTDPGETLEFADLLQTFTATP